MNPLPASDITERTRSTRRGQREGGKGKGINVKENVFSIKFWGPNGKEREYSVWSAQVKLGSWFPTRAGSSPGMKVWLLVVA